MSLFVLFQCDKKEYFIEKIKQMDFEIQTQLVPYIQEVCLYFFQRWKKFIVAGKVGELDSMLCLNSFE